MLVETKAKVGVFAIALGAYLPQFPTLVPEFEAQYEAFKKTIPDTVELVDGGIVTTKELSMKAGDKFRSADVDLVILQLLTYATSYNMLPAVRDLNVPVVLVNVQKRKTPDYANTDTPTWLGELYACGAVGEMVADLLKEKMHLEEKKDFIATRKGVLNPNTLSKEERAALIKEKPEYGNIICRCEMITEGEIIDAIRRPLGAKSLDGVKRRTRAGMGRCQAGFCSPRTMEILARERGVSQSEITKSGGNSRIIVGTNKDSL